MALTCLLRDAAEWNAPWTRQRPIRSEFSMRLPTDRKRLDQWSMFPVPLAYCPVWIDQTPQAHWRKPRLSISTARGVVAQLQPATGEIFPAVWVSRQIERSTVSIIIPTRNQTRAATPLPTDDRPRMLPGGTEVIVVDNDSSEPAMLDFLAAIDGRSARILRIPGPFNFARLNNIAVHAARGEFVCLLNNDIEVIDNMWLDEMLSRCSEPDVGAVGALLAWPSGVVQHGGVVLGSNLAASHAFKDRVRDDPGYTDLLRVAHRMQRGDRGVHADPARRLRARRRL